MAGIQRQSEVNKETQPIVLRLRSQNKRKHSGMQLRYTVVGSFSWRLLFLPTNTNRDADETAADKVAKENNCTSNSDLFPCTTPQAIRCFLMFRWEIASSKTFG